MEVNFGVGSLLPCGFQGSTLGYQVLTHEWIVGKENTEMGRVHSARAGPTGYQGMGR